jgi:streptogramin lyase
MSIGRRAFIGGACAAGVIAAHPQENPTPSGAAAAPPPTRTAKVEKLFKAPDIHPNALEATGDGLWIGDQVSERIFRVDWKTGKVLHQVQTEAHNTSGLAVGAGYLWISCNGGVSNRRPARPTDKPIGEVLQADPKTGKTVKLWTVPWGSGIHGITYVPQTQTLWATALSINALAEMDPKDLRILRLIPVHGIRAHGLDWDNGALWCMFAADRLAHKLDPKSGKVLEVVKIAAGDPDPHGMCIHEGHMYYCDAGLTETSASSAPGYICRFPL